MRIGWLCNYHLLLLQKRRRFRSYISISSESIFGILVTGLKFRQVFFLEVQPFSSKLLETLFDVILSYFFMVRLRFYLMFASPTLGERVFWCMIWPAATKFCRPSLTILINRIALTSFFKAWTLILIKILSLYGLCFLLYLLCLCGIVDGCSLFCLNTCPFQDYPFLLI